MEIEKIRNFTDEELVVEEHKAAEQMFRLRFQISSGQQDGVKKLRELKKDVARFKTIARDRAIHGTNGSSNGSSSKPAVTKAAPKPVAKAAAPAAEKPAKKAATKTAAKSGKAAK
jgi:large subunit ribosomal protein L29